MADPGEGPGGASPPPLFLDEDGARSFVIMHIHKHEDVIDIDGIIAEFAPLKGTVRYRKWSATANDPQNGPQMILDRKWYPKSTANDPERKIGMV